MKRRSGRRLRQRAPTMTITETEPVKTVPTTPKEEPVLFPGKGRRLTDVSKDDINEERMRQAVEKLSNGEDVEVDLEPISQILLHIRAQLIFNNKYIGMMLPATDQNG